MHRGKERTRLRVMEILPDRVKRRGDIRRRVREATKGKDNTAIKATTDKALPQILVTRAEHTIAVLTRTGHIRADHKVLTTGMGATDMGTIPNGRFEVES